MTPWRPARPGRSSSSTRDDPRLAVTPEYQVGTGLVRDDYFDWTRHASGVMASLNPDVAVYMAGANDDQELDVGGRYRAVGDPRMDEGIPPSCRGDDGRDDARVGAV